MPSSHLILYHPRLFLPPIPPSIRVFSNELTLRMRWPKYWSFSSSISPSSEHPELISFRMDWLDLLEVQETLKSLLHRTSRCLLKAEFVGWISLSHGPFCMKEMKGMRIRQLEAVGRTMTVGSNISISVLAHAFTSSLTTWPLLATVSQPIKQENDTSCLILVLKTDHFVNSVV